MESCPEELPDLRWVRRHSALAKLGHQAAALNRSMLPVDRFAREHR